MIMALALLTLVSLAAWALAAPDGAGNPTPDELAVQQADAATAEAAAKAKAEQAATIKAELDAKAKADAEAKELADLRAWKAEQERAKLTAAERAEADRAAADRIAADARAKAADDQRKRDEELTRMAADAQKKEALLTETQAALAQSIVRDKFRELGVPHKSTDPLVALLAARGAIVLTAAQELDEATAKRCAEIVEEFPDLSRRGGAIGANGGNRPAGSGNQKRNWLTNAFDIRVQKTGGPQ